MGFSVVMEFFIVFFCNQPSSSSHSKTHQENCGSSTRIQLLLNFSVLHHVPANLAGQTFKALIVLLHLVKFLTPWGKTTRVLKSVVDEYYTEFNTWFLETKVMLFLCTYYIIAHKYTRWGKLIHIMLKVVQQWSLQQNYANQKRCTCSEIAVVTNCKVCVSVSWC